MLQSLDGAKACGPDGIRPGELNMVARTTEPSITHLVNTSLTSGSIPEEFKTAHVLPLLKPVKKTDSSTLENYRGTLSSVYCI